MARKITNRTAARTTPAPAPKRLGRPVGSKNKVPSATKTRAKIAVATSKRAAAGQPAASATPKMSKADLEMHVVKLERSIARLRKQNAELKQTARDDAAEAPAAKPARATKPKAAPAKAKPAVAAKAGAPRSRRQSNKVADAPPASAEHDDEDMLSND